MNDVNVTEALLKAILELIEKCERSKNSAKASSASWMSK